MSHLSLGIDRSEIKLDDRLQKIERLYLTGSPIDVSDNQGDLITVKAKTLFSALEISSFKAFIDREAAIKYSDEQWDLLNKSKDQKERKAVPVFDAIISQYQYGDQSIAAFKLVNIDKIMFSQNETERSEIENEVSNFEKSKETKSLQNFIILASLVEGLNLTKTDQSFDNKIDKAIDHIDGTFGMTVSQQWMIAMIAFFAAYFAFN